MLHIKHLGHQDREIAANIIGAFGVRGASMIVSFISMPIYIRFFDNKSILGVWYTLLSIMNWVLYFDLGMGNGLRNKLPECFINKDYQRAKKYIASTYITTIILVGVLSCVGNVVISNINWNDFININSDILDNRTIVIVLRIVYSGIMVQFILKLITSILYAIQASAIVSMLTLITSILTLTFVWFSPKGTNSENIIRMSIINVLSVNIPLVVCTIIVFVRKLKNCIPRIKDFTAKYVKEVLNIGIILLWLQLVFMVISNTNEILISHLTNSENVVLYQAYNRIFNTISSLFALALTPIWSAVTKAFALNEIDWITKLYKRLLLMTFVVIGFELLMIPFFQRMIDLWLGIGYITVKPEIAIIFVISNTIMYLHNVNTSFGNGASYFKIQIIWMTVAAVFDIPVAMLMVRISKSWIGVIIANIIALLPFEIIEILSFSRYLDTRKGEICK